MTMMRTAFLVVLAAFAVSGTQAFVRPTGGCLPRLVDTSLAGTTKDAPPMPAASPNSYGEESRKYRRTSFTHEDWVKHRSPDRFIYQLQNFWSSGVYRNVGREVITTTGVATFVVIWNTIMGGYDDFQGVHHAALIQNALLPVLTLPMAPFTLSSPSLGLLLVFRTNTSYQRWDEARKNWGMNINHTRDLVRMGNAYYDMSASTPERREQDLKALSLATWSFVRAMKRHLSPEWEDEEFFQKEMREKLPPRQAEAIINAKHRPNRALYDLSVAVENLPMHFMRKNEIHRAVTIFEDNLGSSERLLTSPVPLFYSRHLVRFLAVWLGLLPFALYSSFDSTWNHIGLIPTTAALSVFLLGIEELSAQMEEPFTILPMQAYSDKIYNWIMEISSWSPGDNGMKINAANKEHIVVWDTKLAKKMPAVVSDEINGKAMFAGAVNGAATEPLVVAAAGARANGQQAKASALRRFLGK